MIKRQLTSILLICACIFSLVGCSLMDEEVVSEKTPYEEDGVDYYFRTSDTMFQAYDSDTGEFSDIYLKGVNIGLGKPNYFPGEYAISYEEYETWLNQIYEMNANCIRVYCLQTPDFYKALYDFNNLHSEHPLYFFQGSWYNENELTETNDVYDESLYSQIIQDDHNTVDAIHGNITVEESATSTTGTYNYDVSKWCIGWILGMESDADVVTTTNENHKDKTTYEGEYISAEDVQPFETFWAEASDDIVSYEMDQYHMQRPLSFSNWPTADTLTHESDTSGEDEISLTTENLETSEQFKCGLFASYHVYPYYPNFLYTDTKYTEYRDENDEADPYEAYLKDLLSTHTMPVLIAEYGIPSSRGITHTNVVSGFNQGNTSEEEQGEELAKMTEDIAQTGCAGGLIFAWQDEWFKRTWNTMDYTDSERRAYWDDVETNEQSFGLLDFKDVNALDIDGDDEDWNVLSYVGKQDDLTLYADYDSAYLYIMVKGTDLKSKTITLGFDITPNSGCTSYEDITFDQPMDFVLTVENKSAEMLVQSWYNLFTFQYGTNQFVKSDEVQASAKDENLWQKIYLLEEIEMNIESQNRTIETQLFDAGKMVYGKSSESNLNDYYMTDKVLEIRIPWGLLNFRDPSSKEIEADFYGESTDGTLEGINIDHINIGVGDGTSEIKANYFTWDDWNTVVYQEKLKKSYYIIQDVFEGL